MDDQDKLIHEARKLRQWGIRLVGDSSKPVVPDADIPLLDIDAMAANSLSVIKTGYTLLHSDADALAAIRGGIEAALKQRDQHARQHSWEARVVGPGSEQVGKAWMVIVDDDGNPVTCDRKRYAEIKAAVMHVPDWADRTDKEARRQRRELLKRLRVTNA